MSSTAKNLEALPNELLSRCFSYLCHRSDIQNLRLTSRKCHANSSSFLILSSTIYMASASLAHMEELCSHPIFSKSIKQVEINCSYYDKCLAESIGVYGDHCGYKLYQNLEMSQRGGCYPADGDALFLMSDECRAFRKEGFFESNPKLTEAKLATRHS